ncbi:MAG TPA: hypothetical protein ENH85_14685 [Candidatus Scalindua sp.]|nr:hypothetical protein [Candidatus Scalindua sp.]
MKTVKEIESAITHLSLKELSYFREWFDEFEADEWDKQFEKDVKEGKLDKLAEQANKDFRENRCSEL